ncbi:hypothetical protein ACIQWN_00870 [Streptomyces vinaceus]|uniref:hypothetical protein n=1 Tax=Streptomyces vinaceus TaxID=1960 RepID=UPI0037F604F9
MIGWWRAVPEGARRWRVLLLPLLALLVVAHVAGANHSGTFTGAHLTLSHACPQDLGAQAEHSMALRPAPAHQHGSDDHVDHTVDRPRGSADAVHVLPLAGLMPAAQGLVSSHPATGATLRRAGPPGGPELRGETCVLRQ